MLVALGVRLATLIQNPLIGADSSRFLASAEAFEKGDYETAIRDPYHPLTAWLISRVNLLQRGIQGTPEDLRARLAQRERAAHLVIMLAGLAVVALSMNLSRLLFTGIPPAAVGLLVAVHPFLVRSSADIMSDSIFLALFLLALQESFRVLGGWKLIPAVTAGVSTGVAYLARPEALMLGVALPLFWGICGRRPLKRVLLTTGVFGGIVVLLISPYVAAISIMSGVPTITMKKDVYAFVPVEVEGAAPAPASGAGSGEATPAISKVASGTPRKLAVDPAVAPGAGDAEPAEARLSSRYTFGIYLRGVVRVIGRWFTTCPDPLAIFFLVGAFLAIRRRDWSAGTVQFLLVAGVLIPVLLLLIAKEGDPRYLSRRHVFTLVLMSMPLAASGLLATGELLGRLVSPRNLRRGQVVLMVLALMGLTAKATRAQRDDQIAQKHAAEWILAEYGPGAIIFTDREKVSYYSGGQWEWLNINPGQTLERIKKHDRALVAFYDDKVISEGLGEILAAPDSGLKVVRSFPETESRRSRNLVVYEWKRSEG
jgi:4-amino-4-deoxy-L-arabinose transferase-like glycosyltransferase